MKLHHAAVLALLGWYLMVPPPAGRNQTMRAQLAVPLSRWITVATFDSANDCESFKRKRLPSVAEQLKENAEDAGVTADDSDAQLLAQLFVRCVASDDPRLKGK